jgi:hypothetical protein
MLGLMPKLRAATADSEKAVLQNAVTATDQQIDALVYELYGLTADESRSVNETMRFGYEISGLNHALTPGPNQETTSGGGKKEKTRVDLCREMRHLSRSKHWKTN